MKTQIRMNTFETNSSSMHSLQILPKETGKITSVKDILEDERINISSEGVLTINSSYDLDFGWGFEILTSFYDKLCYIIASRVEIDDDNTITGLDEIEEAVNEIIPEIKKIKLPVEKDDEGNSIIYSGSIDHESIGTFPSGSSVKNIKRFLSENKNFIIIDNDNNPHTYQIKRQRIQTMEELEYFLDNNFKIDTSDYYFEDQDCDENSFFDDCNEQNDYDEYDDFDR